MSIWNNKTIPFWQKMDKFPNKFVFIWFGDNDPRKDWPESFKPSISQLLQELTESRISYIKFSQENQEGSFFVNILAGKIIVSGRFNAEKKLLFLNKANGFEFATNMKKTMFIKDGLRVTHDGIFVVEGYREFNNAYGENYTIGFQIDIQNLKNKLLTNRIHVNNKQNDLNDDEDEFSDSESSKIEEILETLEAYVNKEYEIEDAKARAEKPFVYTDFKAEDIASTYKYYYRITLLKEDVKRLRELNPPMLQIKKIDETFMELEVFNIKPDNSPNDIVVTTSKQTDRSMIDSSNELYLVAISTLQKVRQRVIDDLRGKVSPNKWLVPLAAGVYKFKKTIKEGVPEYSEDRPLLPAQKDGVDKGAGSKDITLVLGPPGTGKTTVILSWVKFFVGKGKKVLVTSQNNKAVDNVLERLAQEKDLECLRVGNESKVSSSIHNLLIENYALNAQQKLIENLDINIQDMEKYINYLKKLLSFIHNHVTISEEIQTLNLDLQTALQIKDLYEKLENYNNYNVIKKIFFWFSNQENKKRVENLENDLNGFQENITNFIVDIELKIENANKKFTPIPGYITSEFTDRFFYESLYKNNTTFNEEIVQTIIKDSLLFQELFDVVFEWKLKIKNERQTSLYETILDYVDVVGATCIGINSNKQFANIPFDVVIVDESGQIQLHNLMVPLSRASKAILVGDHKQLPPVVDDELATELEEQGFDPIFLKKSWFEILWDPMPDDHKTMLDTQFRCPAIISDFVSKAFYESKYFAGSGMEKKQPILPYFNSTMTFIDTSNVLHSFEQSRITDGRTEVLGNEVETTIIIETLKNFIKELPYLAERNEIGIIVPYKNHVLEVKRTIKKLKLNLGNLNVEDLVASVDSYQGQERCNYICI